MTEIFLVRHGHCSKEVPKEYQATAEKFTDASFFWPISEQGHTEITALSNHIKEHQISFTECISGEQLRMEQTTKELLNGMSNANLLDSDFRIYLESYLDSRIRSDSQNDDDYRDPLYSKNRLVDQSVQDVLINVRNGLFSRIYRKCEAASKLLVVTSREFIVATRFRLQGTPRAEKLKILEALAHNGETPQHELDVLPGEMVHITDTDPKTGEIAPSFRWERLVSPLNPKRTDKDWKFRRTKTYSLAELATLEHYGVEHNSKNEGEASEKP